MSTVSVFVPCHNYARYLDDCLESVVTQDGVDVEILVIDDASTDGSAEVARRAAERDGRVSVRVHDRNRGHIATYNEGLRWASGDYLLLLSADDMLVPGALARAAAVLDRNPNVGLVYGDVPRRGEEDLPIRTEGELIINPGHAWLEQRCRHGYNVVPTPTAVVRTTLAHRVGGYLPDHPHAGDFEMWLRLAVYGDVAELSCHQGIYRRHQENMSRGAYADMGIDDLVACREAFEEVLTSHVSAIPDAARLRALARRSCAQRMIGRASTVYDRGLRRRDYVDQLRELAVRTDRSVRYSSTYLRFMVRRAMGFDLASRVARLRGPGVTHGPA